MADTVLMFFQAKSKFRWRKQYQQTIYLFLLTFITTIVLSNSQSICDSSNCRHGTCENDTCICDQGWVGSTCEACGGRVNLTESEGFITEGYGNYTLDTKCSWLIQAPLPNTPIRLRFDHFATECSWDHLYIYDGDSVYSELIAVLSGLVVPEKRGNESLPEIVAYSGSAYLHFYSDAAYNMSGFNISYKMNSCPLDCSGNGQCQGSKCICSPQWTGEGCEYAVCPSNCSFIGQCQGKCECGDDSGYRGFDCSVPDSDGVWSHIEVNNAPHGRASHKTVVEGNGRYMWVVAGEAFRDEAKFNNPPYQNIARYNFEGSKWESINPTSKDNPEPRYGHSLVMYTDELYMFGGLKGNTITDELWMYKPNSQEWLLIDYSLTKKVSKSEVRAVVGHTAHMVGQTMYVIFGHSPVYGYMNTVQECNMSNYAWKIPSTTGAIVKGGYGHTSVYDPGTQLIYVHAGYHSGSSTTYHLSDSLYSFDPKRKAWKILRSSGQYKYLHSAVLNDGLMLVFGGNTHNDTAMSYGAKCYAADFLVYDIACDRWHTLTNPHLQWSIARFGHSAEVVEDKMYIFGGFNGIMMNDLYVYEPGKCTAYTTEEECTKNLPGVICVWVIGRGCESKQIAEKLFQDKIITSKPKHRCEPHDKEDNRAMCSKLETCPSCTETTYDCTWCTDHCISSACEDEHLSNNLYTCQTDFKKHSSECTLLHNCHACQNHEHCGWYSRDTVCMYVKETTSAKKQYNSECKPVCHTLSTCENCTTASCMWCSNQQRCVESNSYVASFPYGQCMEWTTQKSKCPATRCNDLRTCDECQANPSCGWCDDGSNTGLGTCMDGSAKGPIELNDTKPELDYSKCPADRWFFTACPLCQCNGHSTCIPGTSTCIECNDLTTGSKCELCQKGFYGTATNGGNCTACECNQQADFCHQKTGVCYCRTRGVMGDRCDQCDVKNKYHGNPKDGGNCYYDLPTDYQFTFNLSKDEDKYYTQIFFMNVPGSSDRDVDFSINCTGKAQFNVTVASKEQPEGTDVFSSQNCKFFKAKFSHKKYPFAQENNTTFYVYVYDFQTPFMLQISFSQFPQIDLIHFFITFFSCFLSLLLVALIFWKVKHRYDTYRRRQRMFVEMEQMASRPFSSCSIGVETCNTQPLLGGKKELPDPRGSSRRRKPNKPSPIALEPIHNQKAAVLSLVVRLPTGDEDYTPPGQTALSIGSALVTLGNNSRKASVEHFKSEKSKNRKQAAPPDNCI